MGAVAHRHVWAVFGLLSLVGSLSACGSEAPPVSATPPAVQVPSPAPAAVSVASVHDAATIVLTDGTRLRQVGISAPNAETCQAKQATAAADGAVRQGALTYQLLGQSDVYGNQWAYVQVGGVDLGEKLASTGWVWAYSESPAPQSYNQRITNMVDTARAAKVGLFGSTCPPSEAQGAAPPVIGAEASAPGYRLEATSSTGGKIMVSYGMGGSFASETVEGSWTKLLPEPEDTAFSFNTFSVTSMDFMTKKAKTVTCRVLRDGKVVKEQSATGQTAMVNCTGF